MANAVGGLLVNLLMDANDYLIEINAASQTTADALSRMERDFKNFANKANQAFASASRGAQRSGTQIASLARTVRGLAAGFGIGLGAREILGLADAWNLVGARVRTVLGPTDDFLAIQQELFQTAQESRTSFTATATLFERLGRTTQNTAFTTEELLKVTNILNRAVLASGANAREAEAGLTQFTQGMAAGALRGDEFRSVNEQIPAVASAIARGLGVARGELKRFAEAGRLTPELIIPALLKAEAGVEKLAAAIPLSLGQSFTRLGNTIQKFAGESGITGGLALAIDSLSQSFAFLTDGIKAAGDIANRAAPQLAKLGKAAVAGAKTEFKINLTPLKGLERAADEFNESVLNLQTTGKAAAAIGELSQEQAAGLETLAVQYHTTSISAEEFRAELDQFIQQAGPNAAKALADLGNSVVAAGEAFKDLEELTATATTDELQLKGLEEALEATRLEAEQLKAAGDDINLEVVGVSTQNDLKRVENRFKAIQALIVDIQNRRFNFDVDLDGVARAFEGIEPPTKQQISDASNEIDKLVGSLDKVSKATVEYRQNIKDINTLIFRDLRGTTSIGDLNPETIKLVEAATGKAITSLGELRNALVGLADKEFADARLKEAEALKKEAEAAQKARDAIIDLVTTNNEFALTEQKLDKEARAIGEALKEFNEHVTDAEERTKALGAAFLALATTETGFEETSTAVKELTNTINTLGLTSLSDAILGDDQKLRDAVRTLGSLTSELDGVKGAELELNQTTQQLAETFQTLKAAILAAGGPDAQEQITALQGQTLALLGAAEDTAFKSAEEAVGDPRTAKQIEASAASAAIFSDALLDIATGATTAQQGISDFIASMGRLILKLIIVQALAQSFGNAFGSLFAASGTGGTVSPLPLASGGLVRKPTLALIGERGPELVVPLSQLDQTSGRLGRSFGIGEEGGGVVVNVDARGADPGSLAVAMNRGFAVAQSGMFQQMARSPGLRQQIGGKKPF